MFGKLVLVGQTTRTACSFRSTGVEILAATPSISCRTPTVRTASSAKSSGHTLMPTVDDGNLASDLPDWWPYPVQCGHGHPWSRGHVLCAVPVPRRWRHLRAHRGSVHDRRLPLSLVPPAALPARRSALPRHCCSDARTWLGDRTRSGEHNTVGSQVGSHRQPTPGDSEPTEVFGNRYLPGIQRQWPTPPDRRDLVRIEGVGETTSAASPRSEEISHRVIAGRQWHAVGSWQDQPIPADKVRRRRPW
jgi:hypothetical protein